MMYKLYIVYVARECTPLHLRFRQHPPEKVQHLTRLAAAGGNPVYLSDGVDLALAAFNFRYRRLALHPTLGHLNLRQSRVFARYNPSSA